jgi:hypothetical protein
VFYSTLVFSVVGIIISFKAPNIDRLITNQVIAILERLKNEEIGEK